MSYMPTNVCACVGPVGACPCIVGWKKTEVQISPMLFDLLSDEDKDTINNLKTKALGLYLNSKKAAKD